jgi:hypothetical protein
MVFGFTDSFRMGQLLRYSFTPPKHYEGDDMKYLTTQFVAALRTCLKDGGWGQTTTTGREMGGQFILGYRGQVYQIDSDFQVGWPTDNTAAVGCGEPFALGSLYTSTGKPDARIRTALEAAANFSAGVVGPFTIISGATADTPMEAPR